MKSFLELTVFTTLGRLLYFSFYDTVLHDY